jgi:hypothetical protein
MKGPRDTGGDCGRVEALLTEAGLVVPPLPDLARARLKERAEWCFSTRALKVSPFLLQHFVRKAIEGAAPDYVLIAHAGDGANSYALHYFMVQAPLQLFLQIGWGGAHISREGSAALVNECFTLTHQLVEAVPEAVRRGRLPRQGRLTVVASDISEGFWGVAVGGERIHQSRPPHRRASRTLPGPREILTEALRWCRGET